MLTWAQYMFCHSVKAKPRHDDERYISCKGSCKLGLVHKGDGLLACLHFWLTIRQVLANRTAYSSAC